MDIDEHRRKRKAKDPAPPGAAVMRSRRKALPRETLALEPFTPELCRSQDAPPRGPEWLHEAKWDGYRILATVVGRKAALWSRNGLDWTDRLADVAAAVKHLGVKSAQLDGELVVVRDGHADFNALQARLSGESDAPLHYLLFDLPHLDGASLRDVPLVERKAQLKALLDAHPQDVLGFSEHQTGNGAEVFAQAKSAGVEGIVSKRADSGYSGARSGAWVKVKGRPSDEFVVIGYTPPKGSRVGIGALLLAKPSADGWRYVGRVGTGIGHDLLRELLKKLKRIHTKATDADLSLLVKKDVLIAQWVKPTLVVEVYYQGVGRQGLLRQPAWKGLREDKTPDDLRTPAARKAARKTAARAATEPGSPATAPPKMDK